MSDASRIGIAIDGTTATVAWRSAHTSGAWRTTSVSCDGSPASLARVFDELEISNLKDACVTLLRPLASTTALVFPRMSRKQLETVLERDWSRYIIGARPVPHTTAVRRLDDVHWSGAFAPTDTLDAIAKAAESNGTRDARVTTADHALAAAGRVLGVGRRDNAGTFVLVCDANGPRDAVYLRNGEPTIGRRFLSGSADDDVAAFIATALHEYPATTGATGATGAAVLVLGGASRGAALVRALSSDGHRARVVDVGAAPDASSDAILAIAGTLGTPAVTLYSPVARRVRNAELSRLTRWLTAAAAACVLLAYLIEGIGTQRALDRIAVQRADISPQVRRMSAARAHFDTTSEAVSMLASNERSASRVSDVLTAISLALPPGVALTSFAVSGDSVTIEGESTRAAAAYDAIRGISMLDRVQLAAPFRQEMLAADVVTERFAFSARIRSAR